jgi:hypothetical protein
MEDTTMTYTVKNFNQNPRNNTTETFDNKSDALRSAREMTSDTNSGTTNLFAGEKLIAYRDWNKRRLTWLA